MFENSRFRNAIGLLALLIATLGLTACWEDEVTPLRVGLVVWPPYEMAFLAQDLGYFEEHNIELIDYGSPAEFMVAYQAGSVDAVGTVFEYALELQLADPGQKIALMCHIPEGGRAVF